MQTAKTTSYGALFKQFAPMSLSDMVMALGDPLILFVLASLPNGPFNLAAYAIGKGVAVFFESPIISVLPASNTLAQQRASRHAFHTFVWRAGLGLTIMMSLTGLIALIFIGSEEASHSLYRESALYVLALSGWPLLIALRRYWQGQILRVGQPNWIAYGSLGRLIILTSLAFICAHWSQEGAMITAISLLGGVTGELLYVRYKARSLHFPAPQQSLNDHRDQTLSLPSNQVPLFHFYWPLAQSMITLWGARLALPLFIATVSVNNIAAWSAAWAWVIAISNGVRMIQQLIIRNADDVNLSKLLGTSVIIGLVFSGVLLVLTFLPFGTTLIEYYAKDNHDLAVSMTHVLMLSSCLPLVMAIQNFLQGLLMHLSKTKPIGRSALIANTLLVIGAAMLAFNQAEASSFALLVSVSLVLEVLLLSLYVVFFTSSAKKVNKGLSLKPRWLYRWMT